MIFKYLRFHSSHLNLIDWASFNYPKLTIHQYTERNGLNEIEEIVTVTATVSSTAMPDRRGGVLQNNITLYYETTARVQAVLLMEMHEFNSNTEKYWKQQLVPLLHEQVESEKQLRKASKKREKNLRKGLHKLL